MISSREKTLSKEPRLPTKSPLFSFSLKKVEKQISTFYTKLGKAKVGRISSLQKISPTLKTSAERL